MRKGELIIEQPKTISPGDRLFDIDLKLPVVVDKIEDEDILVRNRINKEKLTTNSRDLVKLLVKDTVEDDAFFEIKLEHQAFIYKNENKDQFFFITHDDTVLNIAFAVVLCKEPITQSTMNFIAPIADAYGMYVASQKAIGEPAKKFSDWYFSISI